MPEPVGTAWTTMNTADWAAGQFIRETKLKQQILQNLQYLAATHNHDGTAKSGGAIGVPKGLLSARPASVAQGVEYYATDLGAKFIYDGRWYTGSHIPRICERVTDDFILNPVPSVTGVGIWRPSVSGAGLVLIGDLDRSELTLSAPTTQTGSRGGITTRSGSTGFWSLQTSRVPAIFTFYGRATGVTLGYYLVGLLRERPAVGQNSANGIYFRRNTTGNWFAVTRNGSSETATDTGVGGGNSGYVELEIVIESVTSVKFYINGNPTPVATHTTNLTTSQLDLWMSVDNPSGGNQSLLPDYVDFLAKRKA